MCRCFQKNVNALIRKDENKEKMKIYIDDNLEISFDDFGEEIADKESFDL